MAAAGRPETADSASSAAAATVTRTTKYSSLGLPGDSHGGGYSVQPCQCQWLLSSLKFEPEIERASDQAAAVATEPEQPGYLKAVRLRLLCGRVGSFASTELVPDTSKSQSSDSNSGRRQTSNWNHLDGLA